MMATMSKAQKTASVGEDVEKFEPWYTGNAECYSYHGKLMVVPQKN